MAFVHDWLVTYRGGEKVLEVLLKLYPKAPIYTLFYDPTLMPETIKNRSIQYPKWLNKFRKLRKLSLPLLPRTIESFNLDGYDLVISTSSCVAKGAITSPGGRHICYLHSPMRYIWDQQDEYLDGVKHIPGAKTAIKMLTPWLRSWDVKSSDRVDQFVVNSSFVGKRAKQYYNRDSVVIPPPVDLGQFQPEHLTSNRQGYFLAAGALVTYKRFDLAIKACESLQKPLIIAGSGPAENQLRKIAGQHTRFEIAPDQKRWVKLMQGAEALLFPGVEDFGMTAIESMACGTPVIAYQKGGAMDFIVENQTGVFFSDATSESMANSINNYDPRQFDAEYLNKYASRYGPKGFLTRMQEVIDTTVGK